jgi:hypothetical protein
MSGSDLCIPRNETAQPRYFQNNYIVLSPNFHIHVTVSDLYITRIGLPLFVCSKNECRNWERGMQFHFWKYINRILSTMYTILQKQHKTYYYLQATNSHTYELRSYTCNTSHTFILYMPYTYTVLQ